MIACNIIKCDTSVSLKLFPLRSVLILILLEQEPIILTLFRVVSSFRCLYMHFFKDSIIAYISE